MLMQSLITEADTVIPLPPGGCAESRWTLEGPFA